MADDSKKILYGILAIVLGSLGIHKFVVGDVKNGVIYLILGLCGIGGILGLITGIMALLKTDEEFEQAYIIEKKFI